MGMFDEVHTGVRCGQTKALGRGLGTYVPGDTARVFPAPMDEQEMNAWLDGDTQPVADSAQVLMHEGGYLTVVDAVFVDWVAGRDPALPLFSGLGHPLDEPVDLDSYLYLSAELESALEAAAGGDFARWPGSMAESILNWEQLIGGAPREREMTDIERTAVLCAEAKQRLCSGRGEPVDCAACAAVLNGTMDQLRATWRSR